MLESHFNIQLILIDQIFISYESNYAITMIYTKSRIHDILDNFSNSLVKLCWRIFTLKNSKTSSVARVHVSHFNNVKLIIILLQSAHAVHTLALATIVPFMLLSPRHVAALLYFFSFPLCVSLLIARSLILGTSYSSIQARAMFIH